MKTRPLSLDFSRPANPVDYDKGRELFAKMKRTLSERFAVKSKIDACIRSGLPE